MALTFELSKCQNVVIRERMLAHLLNIDHQLAINVAARLGIDDLPDLSRERSV
jgi:catalase